MAYTRKYYKNIESQGNYWTLNIYQDTDLAIDPKEIGPVLQGLRLVMQGDQADIDTPIVKTSLEMVFVDAPDLEDDRKNGFWEEFYTSSSTEYRVELIRNGSKEWSGYITPDSFSEDLRYRGSVTIIARDNLGALQDFEYDAAPNDAGLISLWDLVYIGLNTVSCPMTLSYSEVGSRGFPYTPDSSSTAPIYKAMFNHSAFVEKTWQSVIEGVLYATGLTLRYIGGNKILLAPLRDIPLYDKTYWWNIDILDTRFIAYGRRELTPAVKSIKEEVNFTIFDNIIDSATPKSAYGSESTYTYGNSMASDPYIQMPVHAVTDGLFKGIYASESVFLNAFQYPIKREYSYGKGGDIHDPNIMYVAGNRVGKTLKKGFTVRIPAGSYKITMQLNKVVALYDDNTTIGYADYAIEWWRFGYSAVFNGDDGSVKTLNNRAGTDVTTPSWSDGAFIGYHALSGTTLPNDIESPVLTTEVEGTLTIQLMTADFPLNRSEISKGGYMGVANIQIVTVDNSTRPIKENLKITTNYNASNNIILNRKPEYAANDSGIIVPRQIENAYYVLNRDNEYISTERWVFTNNEQPQPLAVLIHQQLLAYYAKPNNVLTGELAIDDPRFDALYRWNGVNHMLISGTLNILTGRMENAVLRQFTRYDHMWETHITDGENRVGESAAYTEFVTLKTVKTITESDVKNLPSWITVRQIQNGSDGVSAIVLLSIAANTSSSIRRAIIQIDTAYMQITQNNA